MAFSNPILSGTTLIRDAIQSENYVPGVSGWAIFRDGNAEFNNLVARGDITANSVHVVTDEGTVDITQDGLTNSIIMTPFDIGPNDTGASISSFSVAGTHRLSITAPLINGAAADNPTVQLASIGPSGAVTSVFISGTVLQTATGTRFQALGSDLTAGHFSNPVMRPQVSALGSDSARTTSSTVFTPTLAVAGLAQLVIRKPFSNCISVFIRAQLGLTSSQGIVGFEVRTNNSAGAVAVSAADPDSIIMSSTAAGNNYYELSMPLVDVSAVTGNVFIRPMYRVTNAAATLTVQRLQMFVSPTL